MTAMHATEKKTCYLKKEMLVLICDKCMLWISYYDITLLFLDPLLFSFLSPQQLSSMP